MAYISDCSSEFERFMFLFLFPTDASVLEVLADIMQVVTGLAATAIAITVFRHNRRTDKESLRDRAWASQQELNYISLANPDVMKAAEFTINGELNDEMDDADITRAAYATFVQLNRIHLLWNGYRSGILSKQEMEDEIRPTLTIILGNRPLLTYCLTRGYSAPFVEFMNGEISHVSEQNTFPVDSRDFIAKLRAPTRQGG